MQSIVDLDALRAILFFFAAQIAIGKILHLFFFHHLRRSSLLLFLFFAFDNIMYKVRGNTSTWLLPLANA